MRVHIDGDIYISGTLGYTIDRKTTKSVRDKETKEMKQEEAYEILGNYASLSGAIKGLLHQKAVSLPNDKIIVLEDFIELIQNHKDFIESKLGGIKL